MVTAEATLIHGTHQTGEHVYRLGEFGSYREAEQMVDRLADVGFPVEHVHLADTGSQSVERMTGRMTNGRATLLGAGLGGWLGLLAGIVLAVSVAGGAWPIVLMGGPLIGAAAGAAMGFITHSATDGRRDSAGTTTLQPRRYAVEVNIAHAAEAVQALNRS
jgi:hypothetical protein